MSSIRTTKLSKSYRYYSNRWARLAEWLMPWLGARHTERWVLRNIDLVIEPGEAVGLVGANGAGKSTLLKILADTTQPTSGSVTINGNIAALLELGMGFHPDFTGRQNVTMAAQLLGISQHEIDALMPQIQQFAEIGDYIDQPLRIYSSGMQMRLAFSVATARRPDILIVDEALSVGDAYFQHKSFERIRELRNMGTTLLMVSHDRTAIQTICDRAIMLRDGQIVAQGKPEDVMDYYNAILAERESSTIHQQKAADGATQTISGTGEAFVKSIALHNVTGKLVDTIPIGASATLQITVEIARPISRLVLGYMIKDRLGQPIYGINTHRLCRAVENLNVGEEIIYNFRFQANLGKGSYSVALALSQTDSHLDKNYEWRDRTFIFHVVNIDKEDFVGCNWLPAEVSISRHPRLIES